MKREFYSFVGRLIRMDLFGRGENLDDSDLTVERRLRALRSAPTPDLHRGRERAMAEALRVGSRTATGRHAMALPSSNYAFAALMLAFGAGILALSMPQWTLDNHIPSGTAMIVFKAASYSTRAVTNSSGPEIALPTPEIIPAPRSVGILTTIIPGTGEPEPVVARTPDPF